MSIGFIKILTNKYSDYNLNEFGNNAMICINHTSESRQLKSESTLQTSTAIRPLRYAETSVAARMQMLEKVTQSAESVSQKYVCMLIRIESMYRENFKIEYYN